MSPSLHHLQFSYIGCSLSFPQEYINQLPNVDHPEAFGQHPNADIASQIKETRSAFDAACSYRGLVTNTFNIDFQFKCPALADIRMAGVYMHVPLRFPIHTSSSP